MRKPGADAPDPDPDPQPAPTPAQKVTLCIMFPEFESTASQSDHFPIKRPSFCTAESPPSLLPSATKGFNENNFWQLCL